MSKEEDISPFEAFSRHAGKKKKKKREEPSSSLSPEMALPTDPLSGPAQNMEAPSSSTPTPVVPAAQPLGSGTVDTDAMFERMNALQKEFNDKLESMCKKEGVTLAQIRKVMDDSSNFTKEESDMLYGIGKQIRENMERMVKKSDPKKEGSPKKKGKGVVSKKTLGQRKKWLSM